MSWDIAKVEFDEIKEPPPLTEKDLSEGFIGVILSYGFGDDGQGNADAEKIFALSPEVTVKNIMS